MKIFFKNLFKRNTIFSIIVILFIVSLLITNILYTNYSNQLITNWYIDSASREVSSHFQNIKNLEQTLNKTSYEFFNKDNAFLSYISGVDRSVSSASYVDITLKSIAQDNSLHEIYIYRKKTNSFVASYFTEGFYSDKKTLEKIISEYSSNSNKKWNFIETENASNGALYYITEDFSGFYTIFSVSPQTLNNKFNSFFTEKSAEHYVIFYDNKYMFDSSALKTGQFNKTSYESFDFNNSNHYENDSKIYINTAKHHYSIISTHDPTSFSSWKLNITKRLSNIFMFLIFCYVCIFLALYIISKRKVFSFKAIAENESSIISIIKNVYYNTSIDENEKNRLESHYADYNSYQCFLVQIDKIHTQHNDILSSSDVLKILYVDIIKLFKPQFDTTAIICSNDTIIVLLASNRDISYNTTRDYLTSLSSDFYKETKHTLFEALGDIFSSSNDIQTAILSLNRLKQFKFLYGYNSLITTDLTTNISDVEYPTELETELINAVILSEHEHIINCIETFIRTIIETNNPSLAKEWIATISFSILKNTRFLYNSSDNDFSWLKKIFESETLDEYIMSIQQLLPNIELIYKENSQSGIERFKRYVMEFLESEYSNPNINIAYIAEKMNMSSTYWGQKFIKEFSVPFNTFLSDYRINKSLKYLKDTNEKISDIALKCGFSNGSYFTKAFRDKYNITPSQFRNSQNNDANATE